MRAIDRRVEEAPRHDLVLFDAGGPDAPAIGPLLAGAGFAAERHAQPSSVVQSVIAHRPLALIWVLGAKPSSDLGVLSLVRLVAPELPLLIVEPGAGALSAEARQRLAPRFVGGLPQHAAELLAALAGLEPSDAAF